MVEKTFMLYLKDKENGQKGSRALQHEEKSWNLLVLGTNKYNHAPRMRVGGDELEIKSRK
jgi:hypothetical protein